MGGTKENFEKYGEVEVMDTEQPTVPVQETAETPEPSKDEEKVAPV